MKIVLSTNLFPPSIGGTETVNELLARHLTSLGCEVTVSTFSRGAEDSDSNSYRILRSPTYSTLSAAIRNCDLFFQSGVSLKQLWPLSVIRKPLVILHHTYLTRPDGSVGPLEYFKRYLTSFAQNVTVSKPLAEHISRKCRVIANPFDASLFNHFGDDNRIRELLYVGRLVSDKGVDTLLEALCELKRSGVTPHLTIAGSGPEENTIRALIRAFALESQVSLLGSRTGVELAELYRSHRLLVVPSRWNEPFGVVALEGIASGCVVIGSSGGGLSSAIGPCGVTFPNGDSKALAERIGTMLSDSNWARFRIERAHHLAQFAPDKIAKEYFALFNEVLSASDSHRARLQK